MPNALDGPTGQKATMRNPAFPGHLHWHRRCSKEPAATWNPVSDFGKALTPATIRICLNDTNSIRQIFVQSNPRLAEDLYRKIGLEN